MELSGSEDGKEQGEEMGDRENMIKIHCVKKFK